MQDKIKGGRMVEFLSSLSGMGGMVLLVCGIVLSGCTSTGHWSAGMVVPKMKGALDTRRIVPLGSTPRSVSGWECDNEPLFLQPGGNAFVSTGILRSLKKNFSSQANALLQSSGEWTVTDYGLWNSTCVRYTGIVATILPLTSLRFVKEVPSGRAPSSPLDHKQSPLPSPVASASVRVPTHSKPLGQSPSRVPRIEAWMLASSGVRIYHGGLVARVPEKGMPLSPMSASRKSGEQGALGSSSLPVGSPPKPLSAAVSQKTVTVPRIEPWMLASSGARIYHGGLVARAPEKGVPLSPMSSSRKNGEQVALGKFSLPVVSPPKPSSIGVLQKTVTVPRIEPWMAPPVPGEIFHGDFSSPH